MKKPTLLFLNFIISITMKKTVFCTLFLFAILFSSNLLNAQIAINKDNSDAHPSAMLDVKSTDKGILVPRMTEAERNAILDPAPGLMVYQTTGERGYYFWDNTWNPIALKLNSNGWNLGDATMNNATMNNTTMNNVTMNGVLNATGNSNHYLVKGYPDCLECYHPRSKIGVDGQDHYETYVYVYTDPPYWYYKYYPMSIDYNIHADGIWAGAIYFSSDKRVKDIIGVSDKRRDLEILSKIKITDYLMKDRVTYGDKPFKKVIAQEVKEIFPQAVSFGTDFIPNIYSIADVKDGWVALKADVKIGDKLRLETEAGKKEVLVVEVTQDKFKINYQDAKNVFFYGKEVKDFHTVDYEALSTLNISATQALLEKVNALEKENQQLKADVGTLSSLKADVEELKALLKNTGKTSSIKE